MEKLYRLFEIQCQDLLVLADMEYNGMLFDVEGARRKAKELERKLEKLVDEFARISTCSCANINSDKHISAILYGGVIMEEHRIPVGIYKSGSRKGQVRYSRKDITHTFERKIDPLKNTETVVSKSKRESGKEKDSTQWSVGEEALLSLKAKGEVKELIAIVLEYRKLEKLRGTYLEGWSNLIEEQGWEPNMIHGNLNQCVAVTGRLTSTKPNLQNADKETKQFLVSRYN